MPVRRCVASGLLKNAEAFLLKRETQQINHMDQRDQFPNLPYAWKHFHLAFIRGKVLFVLSETLRYTFIKPFYPIRLLSVWPMTLKMSIAYFYPCNSVVPLYSV